MFQQLPLSVTLRVDATFDSYYTSGSNARAVNALNAFCESDGEHFFSLWGAPNSGVTHLLQAVQNRYGSQLKIQYLPLLDVLNYPAKDVLCDLEQLDLVILDDIEAACGNRLWEMAIFHLYNRLRDYGKRLLVGSHVATRELPIQLPDLQSRFQWGLSERLLPLNDDDKKRALISRAKALGLNIGEEVVQFILNHGSRDIPHLMSMLDTMDKASLAEKRHLTIPFVKQVLEL